MGAADYVPWLVVKTYLRKYVCVGMGRWSLLKYIFTSVRLMSECTVVAQLFGGRVRGVSSTSDNCSAQSR